MAAQHLQIVRAAHASPSQLAQRLQKRWRHSHYGGRYGPTYRHMPTEVKLSYPPKDRSQLWKLPDSKKIIFVTNGWYYPEGKKGRENKVDTPVVTFAAAHSHNHLDSLTAAEWAAFDKLVPTLQAQFAECKKRLAEEEAR